MPIHSQRKESIEAISLSDQDVILIEK